MNDKPSLRCACGVTAFTDIRFSGAGVMSLTCFHCRQVMQISMSVVMAERAWAAMEREAPEPVNARRADLLERAPSREQIDALKVRLGSCDEWLDDRYDQKELEAHMKPQAEIEALAKGCPDPERYGCVQPTGYKYEAML